MKMFICLVSDILLREYTESRIAGVIS